MQGVNKCLRFLVAGSTQRRPLARVQCRRRQHRRRYREAVGGKKFEQTQRQRQRGDSSGGGGPQRLVHPVRFATDRLDCIGNNWAAAVGAGARNEVN